MKKNIFLILIFSSLYSHADNYSVTCTTDTSKKVEISYSYNNGYALDSIKIDGTEYKTSSDLSMTRGAGLLIEIKNYRNGETLHLNALNPLGSKYKLGASGSERTMDCKNNVTKKSDDAI